VPVLKGKWLIGDQLKRPANKHIFSVEYDEFSSDNKLNRVFRFVVERLWQLTRESGNRQRLGELRELMDKVALVRSVSVADANPAQLTRINQRFGPLLNLSCLFLDGGTLQIASGDVTTFAFVFDMNKLFEAFIASCIRKHRGEILEDQLLDCEVLVQSRGATLFLAQREKQNVFKVQPDIAFRDTASYFPLLVDTKYKRLDRTERKLGISQGDFYQMHAYAHRYQSPRVLLLYPQSDDAALHACFPLQLSDKIVEAATVDIRLDFGNKQHQQKLVASLRTILRGVPHDKE
jgi:5-methylcytosine-specific restriction enzyme subunit McrC